MARVNSDNSTGAPAGRTFTPDTARLAKEEAKRRRVIKRLRKLRAKAADEIDRLLEFLDASDIDPDLEPTLGFMNGPAEMDECEGPEDGDEPSLGFLENHPTHWNGNGRDRGGNQEDLCAGLGDDREEAHDDREPEVDEPSMGSSNDYDGTGTTYQIGNGIADGEPSLGWPEQIRQRVGLCGGLDDREQCVPVGTAAAYRRYRRSRGIPGAGLHAESGYGSSRRIQGLTVAQRKAVRAKMKNAKVLV